MRWMILPWLIAGLSMNPWTTAPASAGAGHAGQPRIEARTDGVSANFILTGAPPGTILNVSLKGPSGSLIYEARQASPLIEWLPEAGAREGRYRWEAYAVLPPFLTSPGMDDETGFPKAGGAAAPGQTLTGGVIEMENGILTIVPGPLDDGAEKSSPGTRAGFGDKLAAKSQTISNFIEIEGSSPALYFDDTGTSGWEWTVEGLSRSYSISRGANSPFIINEAAAHGSIAIDQDSANGNARVGVGTASPIRDIEIQSTTPSILLDESDFGAKYQLGLRDGTLRYQSLDTLDIQVRIEHGAPQNSLFIENTGDVGLGTSSPTAPLHIADTGPAIALQDTDQGHTWVLRNRGSEGSNFQVFDPGAVTRPFQVAPGAPTNTLYLDDTGRVGIGTNSPQSALHISQDPGSGTGIGLRIENTAANTQWNLFNAGSLKIIDESTDLAVATFESGAPNASLFVEASGQVGLGTTDPAAGLHVRSDQGDVVALLHNTSSTTQTRAVLQLVNNGAPEIVMQNESGTDWTLSARDNGFSIHKGAGGVALATVEENGDIEAAGTLTEGSSISIKENIVPVHGGTVLRKLGDLPLSEWSYIGDSGDRHIGPMAEDFHALFGLGPDNRHIAPKDLAGIALVAAKTLRAEVQVLKSENRRLRKRLAGMDRLDRRMRELERMLGEAGPAED